MTRARRPNISSQESQRVAFRLEVVDSTSGALCFLGNLPSEGCVPFPLQGRQLGLGLAHRRRIKGIKGTRSRGRGPRRVQLIFRLLRGCPHTSLVIFGAAFARRPVDSG